MDSSVELQRSETLLRLVSVAVMKEVDADCRVEELYNRTLNVIDIRRYFEVSLKRF